MEAQENTAELREVASLLLEENAGLKHRIKRLNERIRELESFDGEPDLPTGDRQ